MTCPTLSTAAQNEDDGQETEASCPEGSTSTRGPHELPLYVAAPRFGSTPGQNVVLGHDTDVALSRVLLDGELQLLPLYVSALPAPSRARQKVEVGHDTATSGVVP